MTRAMLQQRNRYQIHFYVHVLCIQYNFHVHKDGMSHMERERLSWGGIQTCSHEGWSNTALDSFVFFFSLSFCFVLYGLMGRMSVWEWAFWGRWLIALMWCTMMKMKICVCHEIFRFVVQGGKRVMGEERRGGRDEWDYKMKDSWIGVYEINERTSCSIVAS